MAGGEDLFQGSQNQLPQILVPFSPIMKDTFDIGIIVFFQPFCMGKIFTIRNDKGRRLVFSFKPMCVLPKQVQIKYCFTWTMNVSFSGSHTH
jgi:hypothetical protein